MRELRAIRHDLRAGARPSGWRSTRVLAVAVMSGIGSGLLAAIVLGAPLVSFLLAGLLLWFPLLLWMPYRIRRPSPDAWVRGSRR